MRNSSRPFVGQRAGAAGAEGVGARSVVGQTDHAQPVVPPEPGLLRRDDRVGAFHEQDEAERRARRVRLPGGAPGVQVGSGADEPDDPLSLQLLVVGELPLCLGEGDLVGAEVDVAVLAVVLARDHRGEDEPDLARPQIREPDRPRRPPLLGHPLLALDAPRLVRAEGEIAIPHHGVHRQIEMSVDDEHGCSSGWLSVIR